MSLNKSYTKCSDFMENLDETKFGSMTKAIHGGIIHDTLGAVNVPIYASSTFSYPTVEEGARRFAGEDNGFVYGRLSNPSVRNVEVKLALLESAEDALVLASGMAAVSTFIFTVLKKGDHLICDHTLYGGTHSLFTHRLPELGIEVTFVDASNPEEVEHAIKSNTKLIYFETVTNPTLRVVPIEPIVKIAQEHGIMTAVDSTFMSPILQRPIEQGINIVIHSATKYLNGHSDIIAGVIAGDTEIIDECRVTSVHHGGILGPFEAFLLARGLKTLKIRVEAHEKNAKLLAEYLTKQTLIKSVHWLGLPNSPYHEIAKKQQDGFGSMITFEIDGDLETAKHFVNCLKLSTKAVSLGGVESLISHPASTTHSIVSEEDREKAGITDSLMRLSVGLEDIKDLIADFDQALTSTANFINKKSSLIQH